MRLKVFHDGEEITRLALKAVRETVREKPNGVFGFPAGQTFRSMYAIMRSECSLGKLVLERIRAVQLDEYLGLPDDHPRRFSRFLLEEVFAPCGLNRENLCLFCSGNAFREADGLAYDARVEEWGGIDLQLLGIGANGHVGFNEPAKTFSEGAHSVLLTEETRRDAAAAFGSLDKVPRQAVTLGIGSLLRAKKILLLAMGEGKARAIQSMLLERPSPQCPASGLVDHPNLTILIDEAAASLLPGEMVKVAQGGKSGWMRSAWANS